MLQFSGVQRLRPTGDFPSLGLMLLCFLQCFDRKGIWPIKMYAMFFSRKAREKTEGEPANPGSLGKWPLKWRWWWIHIHLTILC